MARVKDASNEIPRRRLYRRKGIGRQIWKWGFAMDGKALAGQAATKAKAIEHAERAIDRALAPKKLRLVPPSD